MAKVRNVEKRIYEVEGFEVTMQNGNGRAFQSNVELPMYNRWHNMAKHAWTVQRWKDERFGAIYPGCKVKVQMANGAEARGHQHLSTVRDTYLADDE
jgi:hypothetical protein